MKKQYSAPKLTVHGNVTAITQILGSSSKKDFLFLNGTAISGNNDLGSVNVDCTGNSTNLNCTTKPN